MRTCEEGDTMRERHPKILLSALVAALALAGLIVAGCGSSDSTSSTTAATAATTAAASTGGAATIDVADNPDLGKILTDADGNTVYLFEKDENGMSNCSGGCAAEWPPVTTSGSPKAGSGADDSLLGTIKRDDGSEQVTYDDHPLYTYSGDTKAGDTNGNGLELYGAEWYAMTPDGSNAEPAGGDESTSTGEDSTSTGEDTSSGYSSY
jgi:predicted lipoprotein with Yx(FWY)xxD motif